MRASESSLFSSVWGNVAALCISGLAIGWMVGLSVSPVIQGTLESVLGVAAAVVAGLAGIHELGEVVASVIGGRAAGAKVHLGEGTGAGAPIAAPGASQNQSTHVDVQDGKVPIATPSKGRRWPKVEISAIPLAGFTTFLALGATAGLCARIHNVFSPTPSKFIAQWQQPTGATDKVLARLLLESEYPDLPQVELRDDLKARMNSWGNGGSAEEEKLAEALISAAYAESKPHRADALTGEGERGNEENKKPSAPSPAVVVSEGPGLRSGKYPKECDEVSAERSKGSFSDDQIINIANNWFDAGCKAKEEGGRACAIKAVTDACPDFKP